MESQEHENKPAIGPRSLKKGDPRARQTGKLEVYAYALTDASFGEFHVLNSANGWWLDRWKLEKLIDSLKLDCTIKEACFYAGITPWQWRTFMELHPEFAQIVEICRENLGLHARRHFAKRVMEGDDAAVMTYLRKKHKAEFAGQMALSNPDGTPMKRDNAIVFVDFGEVVKTEPYDPHKENVERVDAQPTAIAEIDPK